MASHAHCSRLKSYRNWKWGSTPTPHWNSRWSTMVAGEFHCLDFCSCFQDCPGFRLGKPRHLCIRGSPNTDTSFRKSSYWFCPCNHCLWAFESTPAETLTMKEWRNFQLILYSLSLNHIYASLVRFALIMKHLVLLLVNLF